MTPEQMSALVDFIESKASEMAYEALGRDNGWYYSQSIISENRLVDLYDKFNVPYDDYVSIIADKVKKRREKYTNERASD